ncbi:MAG: YaiI/YqxD family protein [Nitrospirae bacterium]|nr:YaiI/YqxD family protein [Nitrospirota bacterium]
MQIYVDADACPVRDIIHEEALRRGVRVTMVVSMAHNINEREGMSVLRVDSSFQAVDIAIINRASSGDIVVTSDYGLASLVLGNGVHAISPSGRVYTERTIDSLLEKRHQSARQRRGGGRVKGPRARHRDDDDRFRENFIELIEGIRV